MTRWIVAGVIAFLVGFSGMALVRAAAGDHHGVDEICKAFPSPDFRRPINYAVVGPDGEIYATGGCA